MWKVVEKEKNAPDYMYSESYDTLVQAKERMRIMYHDVAVEGNMDIIEKASIDERSASVVFDDGNEIWWDIIEEKGGKV